MPGKGFTRPHDTEVRGKDRGRHKNGGDDDAGGGKEQERRLGIPPDAEHGGRHADEPAGTAAGATAVAVRDCFNDLLLQESRINRLFFKAFIHSRYPLSPKGIVRV